MPGGSKDGYDAIRHIVEKVAAQVDDGPCVTYIGPGGAGTFLHSHLFRLLVAQAGSMLAEHAQLGHAQLMFAQELTSSQQNAGFTKSAHTSLVDLVCWLQATSSSKCTMELSMATCSSSQK